jgi:hypothetical protein
MGSPDEDGLKPYLQEERTMRPLEISLREVLTALLLIRVVWPMRGSH